MLISCMLIKKRVYLTREKVIFMYQSDFRTNHSTDLSLAQLVKFVSTSMDKRYIQVLFQ